MLKVEFHCHTIYSKDSLTQIDALLAVCRHRKIDRIVITDHNAIAGAQLAQKIDPEHVIVGEEIMTQKGEILAAYVQELIPAGLPPMEVIQRLRDQGAFISVSHPFDKQRKGAWRLEDLVEIAPRVDAIEVFNARCLSNQYNDQARQFAMEHHLGGTVGSDAHILLEVGHATLLLPEFDGPEMLKQVIHSGQVVGKLSSPLVHFSSTYAKWCKKLGLVSRY